MVSKVVWKNHFRKILHDDDDIDKRETSALGKNIYIQKSPQELDLETHTTDWLQNGYMPIYVGSVINMKCTISSPMQNEKWD